jgi:hypothetical protein
MNLIKKALVFFVCIAGIPSWAQNQPQQPSAFPGNGQVKLKWTANSDTVTIRYRVYADTSVSEQTQVDSTTSDSIVVSGLTNGQIYYFRISAVSDTGQSALSSADAAVPIGLPGRTGKFNGSGSYAEIAYTSALNPSEFTVEMWVKSNNKDNTTHRKVLSSASMSFSLGYTGFEIQQTYYNGVIWSIWVYGSGGVYDVTGPAIDTSRWTHLAVTQSGGTWSLYVDGELANTQSPGYSVLNNPSPLRIGASSTGSPSNALSVAPNWMLRLDSRVNAQHLLWIQSASYFELGDYSSCVSKIRLMQGQSSYNPNLADPMIEIELAAKLQNLGSALGKTFENRTPAVKVPRKEGRQ